jgi:V/A-type H+-transporting ATPase subunit I
VFAVIAGPRVRQDEIRGLLAQAGWRELPVPDELRTHPQAARSWMEAERVRLDTQSGATCQVRDGLRGRFGPRLHEARLRLALARPLAEAALAGVRGRGGLAALSGWIPRRQLGTLRDTLDAHFHGRYRLDVREPAASEIADVPSLVRYPGWLAPFVPLVKSYGIPRYGEFDPALPFAFTYLLLFGAMFGDVGHGAVILLLAAALSRRLGRMAWVGIAAGAVSMLFGVLYGSIFGYEDLIEPIWLSPLHDPIRVLTLAVGFGVGFIAFTLLVNAYNKAVAGRTAEALFDSTGLAGLAFYIGAVGLLADLAGAADVARPAAWLAGMGIAVVAAFKWFEARAGLGERILVTAIETLETAINLFSNTLSFMRVAAFSLNHVALALAVFTLASGLDAAGHGITIVLGNVVIIVLEGAIVAIQALRLMYYEGFSRFFSGDGREFVPLRLSSQQARV